MNAARLFRAAVVAVALVVPGFAATTASAHDFAPPSVGHHHGHYHVYCRECSHSPWYEAATFDCSIEARNYARQLRFQGYEVRVSHHH